ncbi:MAG: peptidylprolyl isomerase [Polyangiaceae bacterium]
MKEPAAVIAHDSFVRLKYAIYVDGDPNPFDMGDDDSSAMLEYVHGYGLALPALEKGLLGETSGTHITIDAEPEDAFGPHEPEGILEVDKEGFEQADQLSVGDELVAESEAGSMLMRVLEVREDSFVVDTNHPLAGKKVRLEVDIEEVRAATEAEIADAQDEAEDLAHAYDDCCDHDHGDGEGHHHHHHHGPSDGHGHDHAVQATDSLVQLGTKKKGDGRGKA